MNTRAVASEIRISHWAQIMQERNERGVSVREYCKTAGIKEYIYYYWQRKLRETVCRGALPNTHGASASNPIRFEKPIIPTGWAVCEPEESVESETALSIEIGGCRILVNSDVDTELLLRVCRVLKSLC